MVTTGQFKHIGLDKNENIITTYKIQKKIEDNPFLGEKTYQCKKFWS